MAEKMTIIKILEIPNYAFMNFKKIVMLLSGAVNINGLSEPQTFLMNLSSDSLIYFEIWYMIPQNCCRKVVVEVLMDIYPSNIFQNTPFLERNCHAIFILDKDELINPFMTVVT